ncbi:TadE/TadG family type IV pilus assembly protein [Polycladidibacter hongkongensis]|uniref:TadE/TadG family type IV pilus assembly protein n=1 Tax=Polycladidibacter hongkongensis TaxID=1647556 RepID=UPI000833E167|nr:TadE/TadG family type IV pilus assembly protein [Pseudovibrio hongkongensis]
MLYAFVGSERGAVAPIFALMAVVLIVIAGFGIDFARAVNAKRQLQYALDYATLVVVKDVRKYEYHQQKAEVDFREYFKTSLASKLEEGISPKLDYFEFSNNQAKLTARTSADVPTYFMRLLNLLDRSSKHDHLTVAVDSRAEVGTANLELALVVDVTSSMRQDIPSLKRASKLLIEQLIRESRYAEKLRVRMSIVPYSSGVQLDYKKSAAILGEKKPKDGKICVIERLEDLSSSRRGKHNNFNPTDEYTYSGNVINRGKVAYFSHFLHSPCPRAEVLPLTSRKGALLSKADELANIGTTAGHAGLNWGYFTLSPKWGDFWASYGSAQSRPSDYSDQSVRKAIIFMTDGEFNSYTYQKRGHANNWDWAMKIMFSGSRKLAEFRVQEVCAEIRKDGIELFTLAFDNSGRGALKGSNTERILKECATDPQNYIYANKSKELVSAFEMFGSRLTHLHLSK